MYINLDNINNNNNLKEFIEKIKFIDIKKLCINLITNIKKHVSYENRMAKNNDKILTGYINILNIILKYTYGLRKIIGIE